MGKEGDNFVASRALPEFFVISDDEDGDAASSADEEYANAEFHPTPLPPAGSPAETTVTPAKADTPPEEESFNDIKQVVNGPREPHTAPGLGQQRRLRRLNTR